MQTRGKFKVKSLNPSILSVIGQKSINILSIEPGNYGLMFQILNSNFKDLTDVQLIEGGS